MVKPYILHVIDPTIAWKVLAKIYPTKTIRDVLKFLDRWESIKMSKDILVSTFMQHVYDLLNDLKEIDKLTSNILIVHKILKNLSFNYETFIKLL